MRTGLGFDVHAFGGSPPLLLGGVVVDSSRGLKGTSDADVVAHAVADALLGASALGDLGEYFPSEDPAWSGADSMDLLRRVTTDVSKVGFDVVNVDLTIVSESVRVAPYRAEIRQNLARALHTVRIDQVSVKATTTDSLGSIGRDEGVAALAIATVVGS